MKTDEMQIVYYTKQKSEQADVLHNKATLSLHDVCKPGAAEQLSCIILCFSYGS